MVCIICKKDKSESKEHIIPEALGNKTFITNRVCRDCNSKFGANVDTYLTNHEIIKLLRIENGLTENDGKPIRVLNGIETDANTGIKYLVKNNKLKIAPKLIFPQNNTESVKVVASNLNDGIGFLKKFLKRHGISENDAEEICKEYYIEFGEKQNPEFDIECIFNYSLFDFAVLKIVYEYSHYVLGDDYLNDEIALLYCKELYLSTLLNKKDIIPSEELAPYITFPVDDDLYKLIIDNIDKKCLNQDILHLLMFFQSGNSLYCIVSLFLNKLFTFMIKVTDNCQKYKKDISVTFVKKDGTYFSL